MYEISNALSINIGQSFPTSITLQYVTCTCIIFLLLSGGYVPPTLPPTTPPPPTMYPPTTTPPLTFCEGKANGFYPYDVCHPKFYQCANGVTYLLECQNGAVFNPASGICDWPHNVPECNV